MVVIPNELAETFIFNLQTKHLSECAYKRKGNDTESYQTSGNEKLLKVKFSLTYEVVHNMIFHGTVNTRHTPQNFLNGKCVNFSLVR